MFGLSDVVSTVIIAAVVLWFAQGWYLNERLNRVHAKFDRLFEQFDGLREYLYEIDPQFDEERRLWEEFEKDFEKPDSFSFAGMNHHDYIRNREAEGRRTLDTSFSTEPP
jgi:hypothetical protein